MGKKNQYLNQFEELVLLAIMRLHDNAYGLSILKTIEEQTGRRSSIGAVYTTVERLEEKGYITEREGEVTKERGNRPKAYYRVTGVGIKALEEAEAARRNLAPAQGYPGLAGGMI